MKIIQANKYYYLRGGAERYLFELSELLERHGHQTIPFAMEDLKNLPTPYSEYFVKPVPTEKVSFSVQGARTALATIYSSEAKRKMGTLIQASHPQLVHLQSIYHQLSSSVLDAVWKAELPCVMTVHDFRLLAPNYSLYHSGAVCERGIKHPLGAAFHRCLKGSFAASLLAGAETVFARKKYLRTVQKFIVPSRFVFSMFERAGWKMGQFEYLPHFLDSRKYRPQFEAGEAVTYVGRLVEEKGIETLLCAAKRLPKTRFRIVGTGPLEKHLRSVARQWDLHNVEFTGFLEGEMLHEAIRSSACVVAPSRCYEVFGLSVLEALALGKPALASNIGAYQELVQDGVTGRLVPPGDIDALVSGLKEMLSSGALLEQMGRTARAWVEKNFTPGEHYTRIMEIYQDAMLR